MVTIRHAAQTSDGVKSLPQSTWHMAGSGSERCSTQARSQVQIDTSTGHSDRLRAVVRYSARIGFVWYTTRSRRRSSVRARSRTVSTALEIGSRDMNSP